MTKWKFRVAAAGAMLLAGAAVAQNYPNKTIRFIVPWPPGGGADVLSRIVSPKLAEALGREHVDDERPDMCDVAGSRVGECLRPALGEDGIGESPVRRIRVPAHQSPLLEAFDDA